MLNYYQPFLLPFLKLTSASIRPPVKFNYYHSFEDGLWDLLDHKFPGKKLHFLVPDFYCSDVLDNLKNRGHRYTYYPLSADFQITSSRFSRYLWLFKPDVVIIFHACGLTSQLFTDTAWLPDLPKSTLIIEDSVHRLVNPARIKFLNSRHYIIDSLRKVSPLPGSRMFADSRALTFSASSRPFLSPYFLRSSLLYLLFQLFLKSGFITNSYRLVNFSHHQLLRMHDEVIGDSRIPQSGLKFLKPLFNYLNYSKLEKVKNSQAIAYTKLLQSLYQTGKFYPVKIPRSDYRHLHVYPLGFAGTDFSGLEKYLRTHHLPVWFKFPDTPWSQKRGVLFLPLGFHVRLNQINHLIRLLTLWSAKLS